MSISAAATVIASVVMLMFWHWVHHVVNDTCMSGDKFYMRQFAYTDCPVSPPYCWRPLLPLLARYLGFKTVSYACIVSAPLVVYYYVGGGWTGFACALMFIGNPVIYSFNIRNPEYAEGLGHLLFISALFAMSVDSVLVWPLLLLCALTRETLIAALGLIALVTNPLYLIPLAAGGAVAYFTRKEADSTDGRHPLVEGNSYETVKRWVRTKKGGMLHWAHVIQPVRGLAFAVPFVWSGVGDFARLALVGCVGIFALAIPASGQSRIITYSFALLVPFAAALPSAWLWFFVCLSWFWPIDLSAYDETGGPIFGYAR